MLELACSVACVVGCAAGRDSPRRATYFSLKRKVGKRKVPHWPCPLRFASGQPAMLGRVAALRNSLRACSAPFGQPQRVRARSRACCAARPAPRPALLVTARGELRKTTQAIAALGPVLALLPLPQAGEGWGEGVSHHPSGCAEEHSGRGERMQRSMHPPCDLTRWRCLNAAAQPCSEFDSARPPRAPQVAPKRMRRGRSLWGCFCVRITSLREVSEPRSVNFAYFLLAKQKKVGAPPGAHPGQQHIQPSSPSPQPSPQRGEGAKPVDEGARSREGRP